MIVHDGDYIFKEGDVIKEIFFLVSGKAGFTLPKYNDNCYILVEVGDYFGVLDLIPSKNQA